MTQGSAVAGAGVRMVDIGKEGEMKACGHPFTHMHARMRHSRMCADTHTCAHVTSARMCADTYTCAAKVSSVLLLALSADSAA